MIEGSRWHSLRGNGRAVHLWMCDHTNGTGADERRRKKWRDVRYDQKAKWKWKCVRHGWVEKTDEWAIPERIDWAKSLPRKIFRSNRTRLRFGGYERSSAHILAWNGLKSALLHSNTFYMLSHSRWFHTVGAIFMYHNDLYGLFSKNVAFSRRKKSRRTKKRLD